MIRAYILPPDQSARVQEAGGPLRDADPAALAEMTIAVVEVDGWIVAYWVLWKALHLEPLWVAPAYRHHPEVIRPLVTETFEAARATGERAGFAVIEEEGRETIAPYAARLGFHLAPGSLYYLVLEPAPAPVGV